MFTNCILKFSVKHMLNTDLATLRWTFTSLNTYIDTFRWVEMGFNFSERVA